MHAAVSHGTPSLTSFPKDGVMSCEVKPLRSPVWGLTSLHCAELQSSDEICISRSAIHTASNCIFARADLDGLSYKNFSLISGFPISNSSSMVILNKDSKDTSFVDISVFTIEILIVESLHSLSIANLSSGTLAEQILEKKEIDQQ